MLRVASPCSESWGGMEGDEKVRHCAKCRMNAYNLSNLSRAEVDALLKREGRVCARFFPRSQGASAELRARVAAIEKELRRTAVVGPLINWLDPPQMMGGLAP